MRISRDGYLEEVGKFMHNGLVKVITGIRRCGKSYFLLNIFCDHFREQGVDDDHVVEVRLDEDDFEAWIAARAFIVPGVKVGAGAVVAAAAVAEMREALARVRDDPDAMARMAENAAATAKRFTKERIAAQYIDCFSRLLAETGRVVGGR